MGEDRHRQEQSVPDNYPMSVLPRPHNPARGTEACRFANFLMTPDAQARLPRHRFMRVEGTDAGNTSATSESATGDKRR